MSRIPNSAMPHATASPGSETGDAQGPESRFGQLTEMVREHPKTAVAAGAAVAAAGIVAAAAIRSRGGNDSNGNSGRKKS
jgi:hypothetical protein